MSWVTDDWESAALSRRVLRWRSATGHPSDLESLWTDDVDLLYLDLPSEPASPPASAVAVGVLVEFDGPVGEVPPGPVPEPVPALPAGCDVGAFDFGGRYELDPLLSHLGPGVYERWVDCALHEPDREVHLLDDGAGMIVLGTGEITRIELVGVHRAHRGQGIGRRLLDLAGRRAAGLGGRRIRVGGYEHNVAAMRLYGGAGLDVVGRTWRYHVHRPSVVAAAAGGAR